MSKIYKRKQIEEENQHLLEHSNRRRNDKGQLDYSFDIGYRSQIERKKQEEESKRKYLDSLDKQLQQKSENRRQQRIKSMQTDEVNDRIQEEQ